MQLYEHVPGPDVPEHPVTEAVPFVGFVHDVHGEHTRFDVVVHDVDSYVLPVHAAVHVEHDDAPTEEYVSAAHVEHCVAVVPCFPAVPEYVPAGQETHDGIPYTRPLAGGEVYVLPAGQYAP